MDKVLVNYQATIGVPDTENQGNYDIDGSLLMDKNIDEQDKLKKVEEFIVNNIIEDDEIVVDLVLQITDNI